MRRAASAFSLRPGMETSMYESLLTDFDIQRIMDSGQVFRIRPLTAADGRDSFLAAAGNRAVLIRQRPVPRRRGEPGRPHPAETGAGRADASMVLLYGRRI